MDGLFDIKGLVSLGGTGWDDISMQFASRDFRPCWHLYMGVCQNALGELEKTSNQKIKKLNNNSNIFILIEDISKKKIVRGIPGGRGNIFFSSLLLGASMIIIIFFILTKDIFF